MKHIDICLVMVHMFDFSKLHLCEYTIQVSVSGGERLLHKRNAFTWHALYSLMTTSRMLFKLAKGSMDPSGDFFFFWISLAVLTAVEMWTHYLEWKHLWYVTFKKQEGSGLCLSPSIHFIQPFLCAFVIYLLLLFRRCVQLRVDCQQSQNN